MAEFYAHAQWAIAEEELRALEDVFQSLQPGSLQNRYRLFKPSSRLPRPECHNVQHAELVPSQVAAAENCSPPCRLQAGYHLAYRPSR